MTQQQWEPLEVDLNGNLPNRVQAQLLANMQGTLNATYAQQLNGTSGDTSATKGTVLRAGYDAPGNGRNAGFSVNGALAARNGQADHRLWNKWDYQNVVSIRNESTVESDSAIRFLDVGGLERGAIGFHNNGSDANSPFYLATFIESSNIIQIDGTLNPSYTTVPFQPLRFVTTGYSPTRGYGSYARIGMEANGDTNIYYVNQPFPSAAVALKVPDNGSGVTIGPKLVIGPPSNGGVAAGVQAELDVRGQGVVGNSTVSRSAEIAKGWDFNIIGPGQKSMRMVHENVASVGHELVPAFYRITDPDNSDLTIASFNVNAAQSLGLFGMENFGSGKQVLGFANTAVAPTTNPSGGALQYADGGVMKFRQGDGSVINFTQLAAIASPTAPSATYVQAEAQAMKTAVDALRSALQSLGKTL